VPISPDFFHCPQLPPADLDHLTALGEQAALDLIEYTRLVGGPIDWSFHAQDDNVKLFRGRQDNVPLFCAHIEIDATIDDIIPNFLTTDTVGVRASAFAFFPDIMDIVRLYNIALPSTNRPNHFLGINWCLLDTPFGGHVVKRRDLCYLEFQDDVVIDGRRAWIRALVHVEVAACPDLQAKYGVVRGKMLHSGFIYMECDRPGVLQVFELQHVQPNGAIRGAVGDYLVTMSAVSQCNNLNLLGHKLRAARLSRLQFLPDHAVVPPASRPTCNVCHNKFGHLRRRRHNCRRCGEVVCGRPCSSVWKLMASGLRVRVRLCYPCASVNLPENDDRIETSQSMGTPDFQAYFNPPSSNSSDHLPPRRRPPSQHHHHRHHPASNASPNVVEGSTYMLGTPVDEFLSYCSSQLLQQHPTPPFRSEPNDEWGGSVDANQRVDVQSTMRTAWVTQDEMGWAKYPTAPSDATSLMSTPIHVSAPT
ncbi:hypothetical protein AaE_009073, partial [Aphanomyces astaci]